MLSPQTKNWFKAVLAYTLAFAIILSPLSKHPLIQPRTLGNVCFMTVIHSPAKTVGSYLTSSLLLLICIAVSSGVWTFLQVVGSVSDITMSIVMLSSVVGAAGTNSSGGDVFDHAFLVSIVITYLIGISIGLFVNICIFPDFAERNLNAKMTSVFLQLTQLSSSIISCLVGDHVSHDAFLDNCRFRNEVVNDIQQSFRFIDVAINQASAEITYSRFSINHYALVVQSSKSVAAVLFSIHTVLQSPECATFLTSEEFQDNVTAEMRNHWRQFECSCAEVLKGLAENSKQANTTRSDAKDLDSTAELQRTVGEALRVFEEHQAEIFGVIFEDTSENFASTFESRESYEKMLRLNFFSLATKEFVKELSSLHELSTSSSRAKRHLRFHFNWFISLANLFQYWKQCCIATSRSSASIQIATVRTFLFDWKRSLLSDISIYAAKFSTAILCLQLFMYINPTLFEEWHFSLAVGTIVVALSPVLGQTYRGVLLTLVGISSGATFAYGSVVLFGRGSPLLVLSSCIVGIPFFYLILFRKNMGVLGILSLLAFGDYICDSFANMHNPAFDSPSVYLYKTITVGAVALSFVLLFTLVIYPVFARRRLRYCISTLFRDLNLLYRKIVSLSNRPIKKSGPSRALLLPELDSAEIKELRNNLFSRIIALEPLMTFSSIEPRLEGRFQTELYREIINCMLQLLDRLECMRLSVGDRPFETDVRRVMKFGVYGETRTEMHQTIRVLLYIYSSGMLTKLKILPKLPNASMARDRMIQEFVGILVYHHQARGREMDPLEGTMPLDRQGMLETLQSEKWKRFMGMSVSLREVSRVVDQIGPHLKAVFGEYPDIVGAEEDSEEEVFDVMVLSQ
ncbi:hypothetical protein HDU98_011604 [Podochytrium sp. JEL0797]|nr:hypothetical protein HDU98_011604 [Podochytrium sp. JEL0797]